MLPSNISGTKINSEKIVAAVSDQGNMCSVCELASYTNT